MVPEEALMQQRISSLNNGDASPAITGQVIRNARSIVAGAQACHPQSLRRWAWAVLKSARGQTISQSGLNRLTGRHTATQGTAA
jgi:hypothetical protein